MGLKPCYRSILATACQSIGACVGSKFSLRHFRHNVRTKRAFVIPSLSPSSATCTGTGIRYSIRTYVRTRAIT